jgi:hypothetical protein
MLRLNILPEGNIYPKDERPIRDLLRKRSHLVTLRSSLLISLQNIITRNCGMKMKTNDIKRLRENRVHPLLADNEDLALAGQVSKDSIDFLTRQIRTEAGTQGCVPTTCYNSRYRQDPGTGYHARNRPGRALRKGGQLCLVCRVVSSQWSSNGKSKGKGNKKNGNKYLSWAFSEAAELA